MQEGILIQIEAQADQLATLPDPACKKKARFMKNNLSNIKINPPSNFIITAPINTNKCYHLLSLLWDLYNNATKETPFCGIIFVEQVCLTYPVTYVVNNYFKKKLMHSKLTNEWPMLPVSGSSSMLDSVRKLHIDKFRDNIISLLVSTNALEEGIDVSSCSFVIRYDEITTTKSHIQGSGRARNVNAQIYYFENDPIRECMKSNLLDSIAKDSNLNTHKNDLRSNISLVTGRNNNEYNNNNMKNNSLSLVEYPYPKVSSSSWSSSSSPSSSSSSSWSLSASPWSSLASESSWSVPVPSSSSSSSTTTSCDGVGGEVNFFNCLLILYKYVQNVMYQSFIPEEVLFDIMTDDDVIVSDRNSNSLKRKTIINVKYPSPNGEILITLDDINFVWGNHNIEEIVIPLERLRNLNGWEREKRRAAYAAVIHMRKSGWLTNENKPSLQAKNQTKLICPAYIISSKFKLKNQYEKDSLQKYGTKVENRTSSSSMF